MYFQIVGTHNTANEVFHAVHFESPAQAETESLRLVLIELLGSYA